VKLLAVNAGRSSVRLALFDTASGKTPQAIRRARLEPTPEIDGALATFLDGARPELVAHRVVHGGVERDAPAILDAALEAELDTASALAPPGSPATLKWIAACRRALGRARQVAVFDGAFFAGLPAAACALPAEPRVELGPRRRGSGGLAHRAMWREYVRLHPARACARAVTFHLGAGASAAALEAGRPLDASGPTPFGVDGDVRALLESDRAEARLALDVYVWRAREHLGAYLAVLGGADAILFGGGAGEHQPRLRARICAGMAWCGLELDERRNREARGAARISSDASRIDAWVIPVDEETELAEEALGLEPIG
jgi:acetate kinase